MIVDGISDLLKSLFIPNENFFINKFNDLKNKFSSAFNIPVNVFDGLGGSSSNISSSDFVLETEWGTFKLLDFSHLDSAIVKVKPIFRAFFNFLLILYNFNQFLSLIGLQGIALSFFKGGVKDDN